eukprot:1010667-Rhodomonas_salina.1
MTGVIRADAPCARGRGPDLHGIACITWQIPCAPHENEREPRGTESDATESSETEQWNGGTKSDGRISEEEGRSGRREGRSEVEGGMFRLRESGEKEERERGREPRAQLSSSGAACCSAVVFPLYPSPHSVQHKDARSSMTVHTLNPSRSCVCPALTQSNTKFLDQVSVHVLISRPSSFMGPRQVHLWADSLTLQKPNPPHICDSLQDPAPSQPKLAGKITAVVISTASFHTDPAVCAA